MVVGIIGILAAVAIPAYNNYTNRAARGVTESALLAASRQVNLNKSTSDETLETTLNADITSKGQALSFTVAGAAANKITANDDEWCIAVDIDKAGTKYQAGCIDESGTITYETPSGVTCSGFTAATACTDAGCTWNTVPATDVCENTTGVCASTDCA